jgi:PhnB protein
MADALKNTVQPYLFFDGRCDEALEFYKQSIGAEIGMLMRHKDGPDGGAPDVPGDKVMHASFFVGNTLIMASDGYAKGQPKFEGFCLSLSAKDDADAQRLFAAVGEGGEITQPLIKTFFSSSFGMVKDKFGVHWMVVVPQAMP